MKKPYQIEAQRAVKQLEAIVHPLVVAAEIDFLIAQEDAGANLAVLEIPLLFETGAEQRVDVTIALTAPARVQRERVLARPGMTEEKLASILAKQVPDAQKRRQADFIIDTGQGMDAARAAVAAIIAELSGGSGR